MDSLWAGWANTIWSATKELWEHIKSNNRESWSRLYGHSACTMHILRWNGQQWLP